MSQPEADVPIVRTKSQPDPIDINVGARVRLRRKAIGVSQARLAEGVGLTFQQVQKYERGADRISASMLVKIAGRLEVSVAALVGEAEGAITDDAVLHALNSPGGFELLQLFDGIRSPTLRQAVIELARLLADSDRRS